MAPGTEYDTWGGGHAGLQFPGGMSLLPEEDRYPGGVPPGASPQRLPVPETCSPALLGSGNGLFPS